MTRPMRARSRRTMMLDVRPSAPSRSRSSCDMLSAAPVSAYCTAGALRRAGAAPVSSPSESESASTSTRWFCTRRCHVLNANIAAAAKPTAAATGAALGSIAGSATGGVASATDKAASAAWSTASTGAAASTSGTAAVAAAGAFAAFLAAGLPPTACGSTATFAAAGSAAVGSLSAHSRLPCWLHVRLRNLSSVSLLSLEPLNL
mmetsp:Transcript_14840/g.43576  ORF Transcript_14840/g.43576 Transcript_14840/m.43576 type:complete len:204 (-) Transcript_14840:457-1068(-)